MSLTLRRGKLAESSFWVALLVFTFLVLLSITVGRSEREIDQALVSRYTTYSILGVVGLYAILAKLLTQSRSRLTVVVFGAALFIIVLSTPITYGGGAKVGAATEASRNRTALVLTTYESQPNSNLTSLYPNPEVVRKRGPVLERLGYNVFSEPFHGEG